MYLKWVTGRLEWDRHIIYSRKPKCVNILLDWLVQIVHQFPIRCQEKIYSFCQRLYGRKMSTQVVKKRQKNCQRSLWMSPHVACILRQNLNTIGGCWYFGRVLLVPLRLKNQSLYHKILLLQKFNDKWGKVFKHFIFSLYYHGGC